MPVNSKLIGHASVAFFTVVIFQNCTRSTFSDSGKTPRSQSAADSGGQPYDGKPYVFNGPACADQSASARIIYHNSASASLVKDNCQLLTPPRELTGSEFNLDVADVLHFGIRDFVADAGPAAKLSPLATFYPQLSGSLNTASGAAVYTIDLFDNPASTISQLKTAGHAVMCNFEAGSYAPSRSDAASFPAAAIGNNAGAPQERYVDIRNSTIRAIMVARLDAAKDKGCDGVDLDQLDAFVNNSGFNLTANIEIEFIQYLAQSARARGLLVSVHSSGTIASNIASEVDAAMVDQCYEFNECAGFKAFADAGKAVLITEYSNFSSAQCAAAKASGYSLVFANPALDGAKYQPCP